MGIKYTHASYGPNPRTDITEGEGAAIDKCAEDGKGLESDADVMFGARWSKKGFCRRAAAANEATVFAVVVRKALRGAGFF
jgi:hypothetical protein